MAEEIRFLKSKINRLQNDLYYCQEEIGEAYAASERATARANRRIQAAEYAHRQCELDAESRDWERQDALRDLKRAREWGDEWAEKRALDKLAAL